MINQNLRLHCYHWPSDDEAICCRCDAHQPADGWGMTCVPVWSRVRSLPPPTDDQRLEAAAAEDSAIDQPMDTGKTNDD